MKLFYSLFAIFAAVLPLCASPVKIAVNGEAAGHIAIDVNAPRPVQLAASELQNYLRKITTARYPVQQNADARGVTVFILGTKDCAFVKPFMDEKIKEAVKKLRFDGYGVFRRGNKILIIGNDARGVLNGVHRFIYKHTDFIWVRPYKELAVYTENPELKLEVKDYIDNPAFQNRSWGANGNIGSRSDEYYIFVSRLCNNKVSSGNPAMLGKALDHGLRMEFGGGHNMSSRWLPKSKYGKTNPEYYMLLDGKRRTEGRLNLCYTNPEMTQTFIKETLAITRKLPDYYETINIMIDDTQAFCECDECMKSITLPDGRVLERKDPAFKSTQFFMFLNQVAKAVAGEFPKLQIKCFGYFFTSVPPEIPLEPNLRISYCPYPRNDKETLHGASNAKWLERIKKYAALNKNVIWREYYYSGAGFPRAQANIIAQDLRFINSLGVKMIYSELSWADRPSFLRKREAEEHAFFDLTGPEFWTINMLFWDPKQDPDELRNEYIKRTYREAAPAMMKFYKLIRDSWLNDPAPSRFNSDFKSDMGYYIVNKKLVEPCRAALKEAAAAVKDPRSAKQVKQLNATFESWLKIAESGKVSKQSVTKTENRAFPGFDFDSGVWANAGVLPPLRRLYQPSLEAPEATEIKFMHNSEKMFIAFRCKTSGKLHGIRNSVRDVWPTGDRAEVFFAAGDKGYYHLAFNCFANGTAGTYDALGTDRKWNCNWDVKTEQRNGEWRAVVTVPLKDLKIVVEQNNKARAFFCRTRSAQGNFDSDVHSSWAGAAPHNVKAFGELEFELE